MDTLVGAGAEVLGACIGVGTGGEELVVVEGTSVPTDARTGAAALEIWLGGGNPSSTWEPFSSADPERDGWRWAAITSRQAPSCTSADQRRGHIPPSSGNATGPGNM